MIHFRLGSRNLYHGLQFCLNVEHISWIFLETALQRRTQFSSQISTCHTVCVSSTLFAECSCRKNSHNTWHSNGAAICGTYTLCESLNLRNVESVDQISRVDQIYLNLDQSFSCTKPTWFDQKSTGNFDIWLIPLPSQHQPECLETHLSIVRTPIWREGTESRPIPTPPGCLLAPCDTQSAACALALDICIVSGWVSEWGVRGSEWVSECHVWP